MGQRAVQGAASQTRACPSTFCLLPWIPPLPWDPATLPAQGRGPPQSPSTPASLNSGTHAPPTAASPDSGLPGPAETGRGL